MEVPFHTFSVVSNFFIRQVDKIVHKRAKEIPLAELQNLFRSFFQHVSIVSGFLQHLVIQLFHLFFLPVCPSGDPGFVFEVYNGSLRSVNTSLLWE